MADYAQLKAEIQRRLIDAPDNVTVEVPDLVNDAIKEIQDRRPLKEMEELLEVSTTAGTHILTTCPTNFQRWRERPYYIENTNGHAVPCSYVWGKTPAAFQVYDELEDSPRYVLRDIMNKTSGTSNILVYPLPDGESDYDNGEYRLKLPYFGYMPDLVNDSDENVITMDRLYHRFIVAWGSKLGFELDWNYAMADRWEGNAERIWKSIVHRENMNTLAGMDTLVPHTGADDPQINE